MIRLPKKTEIRTNPYIKDGQITYNHSVTQDKNRTDRSPTSKFKSFKISKLFRAIPLKLDSRSTFQRIALSYADRESNFFLAVHLLYMYMHKHVDMHE